MTKLKAGTKYAILTSYQKICVPVKLLSQILEEGYEIEYKWESNGEVIASIKDIESCKFIDGLEIDHALAEAKLAGTKK